MQLFSVRGSNKGFTLLETVTVIAMIGIVSAIAAPSFLSMYNRSKINAAMADIQGTLQEAQRQAIRTSQRCPLTVSTNAVSGSCLVTGTLSLADVNIRMNPTTAFQFDHKGRLVDIPSNAATAPQLLTTPITIVVSANNSTAQRCLVLSTPLGLVRSGIYTGAQTTTTDTNCSTQIQ